jgi:Ca2+-transporting ATPase
LFIIPVQVIQFNKLQGLSGEEVDALRKQFGENVFKAGSSRHFIFIARDIIKEPMFILLVFASALYFMLGEINEGIMMLVAMFQISRFVQQMVL